VAAHAPAALYSSDLERARWTAEVVGDRCGLDAVLDERLREIDRGDVEGLGFDELPPGLRRRLLEEPTTVRFPGGESYEELRLRVTAALGELVERHSETSVAVVTHAGALRAALATWLGMPPEAVFRLDQRLAAVNVVDLVDGTPLVRQVNG
jgi:broad specificity phosphatase PhoE